MPANNPTPLKKLVALEGLDGHELGAVALRLKGRMCRKSGGGISGWDASSVFYEMGLLDLRANAPSARILVLLYAADLSFRLRWQIEPAIKAGQCVIAAPYVETALAFGRAVGLPLRWLKALFQFAPMPGTSYRIREPLQLPKKVKMTDGFMEFCSLALRNHYPGPRWQELQQRFISCLAEQEKLLWCPGSSVCPSGANRPRGRQARATTVTPRKRESR